MFATPFDPVSYGENFSSITFISNHTFVLLNGAGIWIFGGVCIMTHSREYRVTMVEEFIKLYRGGYRIKWNSSKAQKMASSNLKNTNKSYLCGHIAETVSTEKYTIICKGHVPVYIFPSSTDVMFFPFSPWGKYDASSSFTYMIQSDPRNRLKTFSQKYYSIFRRKTPTILCQSWFGALDAGETFRNETSIGEIQSNSTACKIRGPKFVSVCRLCGKVCMSPKR